MWCLACVVSCLVCVVFFVESRVDSWSLVVAGCVLCVLCVVRRVLRVDCWLMVAVCRLL